MENKFELASGWKSLCGILGIAFVYIFARTAYAIIEFTGFIMDSEVTLFRAIGIVPAFLFFVILLTFSGFMAYFFIYKFRKEQIVVGQRGIEHEAFGYKLGSNWAKAKSIKSIGILGHINGIYIIPDDLDKWLKLPIKWLVNINSQDEYFIPLSMFDINWRDSELGQQIKQYAPHLFQ